MSLLDRLAGRAPVPVFACIGPGMQAVTEHALLSPRLRRAASPREAAVLLRAGAIPERAAAAFGRVHDQLPHPRAVLRWDGQGDPADVITDAWVDLLNGADSDTDRRSDEPPNPWEGKGDHGQGGEGMMGGVPYGRPMAMTGDDIRDGLQLDAYTATVGPFAPMLPPGLTLEITLQGDVIISTSVTAPPFPQGDEASAPHLCAARLLRLLGLNAAAARVARGSSPRALWTRGAIPAGLGEAAKGEDVRARLSAWLAGQAGPYQAPRIGSMLPGLEWHEAMLVLNSYAPDALHRACAEEEEAA
ncbi:hypothetical protein SAMN04488047_101676 [Tranquillimonas alkanivorans]|uniref:Uncharacterized protein n=2 Tax=Tranquillimonas alkanivorans TaxID=441119 RepID=A0A1I5LIX4_9RHOB|nr:hypothetical protein SAMN04488047_101676 [Tranquillimonas alkanivorans]